MSTIKNDSFQKSYGEKILASEVNQKYIDVETSTTALDNNNIRSEGVDRVNITGTPVVKAMQYSWNNYRNAADGGFPYTFFNDDTRAGFPTQVGIHQLLHTGTGGQNVLFLTSNGENTGTPTSLALGDLLRLKFSFNFYSDNTLFDSQKSVIPQTQSAAFIIFPAYKSTSGGTWNAFPHGIDWLQYGDTDGPQYNTTTNIGETFSCPSSDDPTTISRLRDDGVIVVTTDHLISSDSSKGIKEITAHGCLNLIIRGFNAFDIHTIGFFMIGPQYFHDTAPFTGGGRGWETIGTSGSSYIVRIERGNFMAQVMQKGEG